MRNYDQNHQKINNLIHSFNNFKKHHLFLYNSFRQNPIYNDELRDPRKSLFYRILMAISQAIQTETQINWSDCEHINNLSEIFEPIQEKIILNTNTNTNTNTYNYNSTNNNNKNYNYNSTNNNNKNNIFDNNENIHKKEWIMIIIIFDETNETLNKGNQNNNDYLVEFYKCFTCEKLKLFHKNIFLCPVFCGTQAQKSLENIRALSGRRPKQINIRLMTIEHYIMILNKILKKNKHSSSSSSSSKIKEIIKLNQLTNEAKYLLYCSEGIPRLFEYLLRAILKNLSRMKTRKTLFQDNNNDKIDDVYDNFPFQEDKLPSQKEKNWKKINYQVKRKRNWKLKLKLKRQL
ncbi:serine/threonine-protein kinase -related [Anaeramoeba flamelloides]|uniref:Serine/threonine-protein kinase -related n=1 Tax=Anaeramoeba flamelloides TaxID=1746091 RepID=A0AAV7Z191_9EUKA|nr:serine/threonine-protein kinase -related [Anaeramoeba flamelloides]